MGKAADKCCSYLEYFIHDNNMSQSSQTGTVSALLIDTTEWKNVYFSSWCWFTLKNFPFSLLRWFKESLKSIPTICFIQASPPTYSVKKSPEVAKDVTSSNRKNSYLNCTLSYISRTDASNQTLADSLSCMYFEKQSYQKLSSLKWNIAKNPASILYTFYGFLG